MLESIKQYAEALSGLTEVPRKRARRIATTLSKQGVIPAEQIRSVATGIAERSRENRRRITRLVATQVRKQAGALGLATADEIDRLRRRVIALEGGPASKKTSTRKAPVKKARTKTAPRRTKRAAAAAKPKATSAAPRKRPARPRKRASATRRR